jgi:hypothetical protein
MSEQPPPTPPTPEELRQQLLSLARSLRGADHLEPEPKQELAELLDELGTALEKTPIPPEALTHLRDSADQVRRAVSGQHTSPLSLAQDRMTQAAAAFDARAPMVAGIVRRGVESLSNIGI